MKTFVILLVTLAGGSIAQDSRGSENPPDVVILKFGVKLKSPSESSWASAPSLPSSASTSNRDAGIGGGRNNPNLSREETEILNREQQADIERSRQVGLPKSSPRPPAKVQVPFIYSILIKNTGNTTISAIEWVYVINKIGSSDKPWEHISYSKMEISPGKTRELSSVSDYGHPSMLAKPDKNTPPSFTTAAIINRIEYSDGKIWQRASATK